MRKITSPKGLGFLEVIIALSVMIVGVTSGMTLTTYNLANVVIAQNQVLATGLAREPIEIIHGWRDSNWLASQSWNNRVDHRGSSVILQYFDANEGAWKFSWVQDTNLDTCDRCKIVYDDTKKLYLQNINSDGSEPLTGLPATGYRRWTRVKDICWDVAGDKQYVQDYGQSCTEGDAIGWQLVTEVSWYDNQNKKTLSVSEDLYDWR